MKIDLLKAAAEFSPAKRPTWFSRLRMSDPETAAQLAQLVDEFLAGKRPNFGSIGSLVTFICQKLDVSPHTIRGFINERSKAEASKAIECIAEIRAARSRRQGRKA